MAMSLLKRMQAVGPSLDAAQLTGAAGWAAASAAQSAALLTQIQASPPPSGMELVQATEWVCQAKWYRKEDGGRPQSGPRPGLPATARTLAPAEL